MFTLNFLSLICAQPSCFDNTAVIGIKVVVMQQKVEIMYMVSVLKYSKIFFKTAKYGQIWLDRCVHYTILQMGPCGAYHRVKVPASSNSSTLLQTVKSYRLHSIFGISALESLSTVLSETEGIKSWRRLNWIHQLIRCIMSGCMLRCTGSNTLLTPNI